MVRGSYTVAHVGLLIAFLVLMAILVGSDAPEWAQFVTVAGFVAGWHAISAKRIAEVGAPWLHAAPYISVAGLMAGYGVTTQEQIRFAAPTHGPGALPVWFDWLAAAGYTFALAWPVTTILLSILPTRRR